jgi:hypothetical protein
MSLANMDNSMRGRQRVSIAVALAVFAVSEAFLTWGTHELRADRSQALGATLFNVYHVLITPGYALEVMRSNFFNSGAEMSYSFAARVLWSSLVWSLSCYVILRIAEGVIRRSRRQAGIAGDRRSGT